MSTYLAPHLGQETASMCTLRMSNGQRSALKISSESAQCLDTCLLVTTVGYGIFYVRTQGRQAQTSLHKE